MEQRNSVGRRWVILSVSALGLLLLPAEPAQQRAPDLLGGEWEMQAESESGQQRSFILRLTQTGEEISGVLLDRGIEHPLEQGKFAEQQLSFSVNYQGMLYRLKATLRAEALEGSWESSGAAGKWRAQKKSALQADLSGTWECKATSGEMPDPTFTLELKQSGVEVSGTASSMRGSAPARGSAKDNQVEISIPVPEGTYLFTATLDAGKLQGQWALSENLRGTWQGHRK